MFVEVLQVNKRERGRRKKIEGVERMRHTQMQMEKSQ